MRFLLPSIRHTPFIRAITSRLQSVVVLKVRGNRRRRAAQRASSICNQDPQVSLCFATALHRHNPIARWIQNDETARNRTAWNVFRLHDLDLEVRRHSAHFSQALSKEVLLQSKALVNK